ncbi:MAG: ABC transporter substrate-binding protein [Bacteroidetes bacterium]|nr:ABC transporter substrate-binding protein [Bacteroidota bacterium]
MHRRVAVPDHPQRIISLVPSQTELLHALGLGDRVAGVTKFCTRPAEWFRTKPRVGGTKKVDIGKIRALQPDLIIGNKEENERADIEALELEFPVWMSDVNDLEGALDMICRVGRLTGTAAMAEAMAAKVAARFAALQPLPVARRTAYLIWRKPYMAAGPGTFIHDMLRRCGLENACPLTGGRYPVVDELLAQGRTPELLLLSSEPYPFNAKHAEELRKLLPRAQVLQVDGEPFSWYGSRLLHAPAYLADLMGKLGP